MLPLRARTSIGLDIGNHSIKVVELRHSPEAAFLTNFAVKELPPEAKEGKGNTEVVAETIGALIREESIKDKKVFIGVSGAQVAVRRMSLPAMPKKELRGAVRWEARKFVSFPIEEAIVEFQLLGEIVEQGTKKTDLMVSVAEGSFIEEQLAVIRKAGLDPVGICPIAYALYHCTGMIPEAREGIIGLIDIGATKTHISIVKDNRLQFTREITTAGNAFTEAAKEAVALEGATCSFSEAEEIKEECGIPEEDDGERGKEHVSLQKFCFVIRPLLEKLVTEIKQSFEFYKGRFKDNEVRKIFISGGGARLKGIKEHIADQLHVEVELLTPFRDIPPTLTVATGLALGRAKVINLLPEQYRQGRKVLLQKYLSVALACLVFFALFGIYLKIDAACTEYRKELASKEAELAGLQSAHMKRIQLEETKKRLDQEEILFTKVSMEQLPWEEILKEISHIVPQGTTLTGLFLGTKETGKELRIKGVAFGGDESIVGSIVEIMEGLERAPFFSDVRLSSSEENNEYNKPGATFELMCRISP